jgi:hypothetical protein
VDADVTLTAGTEDNALALWASDRVTRSLEGEAISHRDFHAMRAAVAMVAPDKALSLTLRFDHGHVAIHDGMLGIPDVTFCGDYQVLTSLENLPLSRFGRLPLPPLSRERAGRWRHAVADLVSGDLKIYGLLAHPRLVSRVLRLLSTS